MTDTTATPEVTTDAPAATAVPTTPDASLMAPAAVDAPAKPQRPDGLPDAYWDDETGVKPEAYARLAEIEAAAGEVPEAPDGYSLALSEEIVGLDGKPVQIDADDPLAKAILPALHEGKVPQGIVSKIVQAYAAQAIADAKAEADDATKFIAAEQAKLGAEHAKRTAALHGQLIAAIGKDAAEAIRGQMRSADAVIALEQLISKIQGPAFGAAPLSPPALPDLETRLYGS